MKAIFSLACAALLFCAPQVASAQDTPDRMDMLAFAIGYYDILDDDSAADFRLEYRPGTPILWELKPWVGIEATTEGTIWGGGGVLYDWNVAPKWYVTPSFGVGLYTDGSSDLDLDYPIEFRSQLEVAYEFDNSSRIGLGFSHTSNAGLGDSNPGVEVLMINYSIPVNWF